MKIGIEIRNNSLELFVEDTGIGIKEEFKDVIFERFRQGCKTGSFGYEGLGLGLSISKAFVERMNGEIMFTSEYGKGSIFQVILPLL